MAKKHCQSTTRNHLPCPFASTHIYEGRHLCKIHLNLVKSEEDCAICYHALRPCHDHPPSVEEEQLGPRVRLDACKHYFHRGCLEKSGKPECPLCRTPISFKQCIDIFGNLNLDVIGSDALRLSPDIQSNVLECFEMINGIGRLGYSQTRLVNILIKVFRSITEIVNDDIHGEFQTTQLVGMFCQGWAYLQTKQTLAGLTLAFDADERLQLLSA